MKQSNTRKRIEEILKSQLFRSYCNGNEVIDGDAIEGLIDQLENLIKEEREKLLKNIEEGKVTLICDCGNPISRNCPTCERLNQT